MVHLQSRKSIRWNRLLIAAVLSVDVASTAEAKFAAPASEPGQAPVLRQGVSSIEQPTALAGALATQAFPFSMPSESRSNGWISRVDAKSYLSSTPPSSRDSNSANSHEQTPFLFGNQQPLWKILLHRLPLWLSKLKDVVVNVLILVGLFSLTFAFWWEWRRNVVVIDALDVPKDLTEKGFSGAVLAQRLADEIHSIQRVVKSKAEETGVEIGGLQTDFQVPAANLSLKTLVRYVRQVFKRNEIRIRGEVTTQGDKYSLLLRTSNGRATPTRPARSTKEFERLLKNGAEDVILLAAPTLAMQYRFLDEFNCSKFPRTLDAVKFYLSTTHRPKHKIAYTVWGNVLAVTDDFNGAIEKYKTALSIDSRFAPAYNGWGNALRRRQEFDSAREKYRQAIRHSKDYDVAMINLGLVFLDKKQPKEASRWFAKALRINPVSPSASLNLGMSKRDIGQTDEALRYIRQSLDVDPNFAAAYLQLAVTLRKKLRRKDAIAAIKKGLALGFPMPNLYAVWGDILHDTSEFALSIEKYEEALRSSSEFFMAKLGKSRSLFRLGKFDAAIAQVRTVVEQAPKLWQAPSILGDMYLELRRLGEARTQYTKALQMDGGDELANIGLSRIDEALCQYSAATERLLKSIETRPESTATRTRLGWIQLAMHQSSEALKCFSDARQQDEYSIGAVCGLGDYYRYRLDLDESLRQYRVAIEMDERALPPLLGLASTLSESDRRADALTAYNTALEIDPNNLIARVGRIDTLRMIGGQSALQAWTEARRLSEEISEHPVAYVAMGNLALDDGTRTGDSDHLLHAMNCFECALARDPFQSSAQLGYARAEVRVGQPDKAVARLVKVVEQNRFLIGAYLLHARILLTNLGRINEAWHVFKLASEIAPESPRVFFEWAKSLKEQTLIEEAVSALEHAAELAPNHYPISLMLSETRTTLYGKLASNP